MRYKPVWKIVGVICSVGLVMILIGFVVGGDLGGLMAGAGVGLCFGAIGGGSDGAVIGISVGGGVGWVFGGLLLLFMGTTTRSFIGMMAGPIFGVPTGGIMGLWSEKKKEEIKTEIRAQIMEEMKANLPEVTEIEYLTDKLEMTQEEVINNIQELMEERNIGGEIDQLKGVYVPESKKSEPPQPSTEEQGESRQKQNTEVTQPPPPDEKTSQYNSQKEIKDKISNLEREEKMIDTRPIESALMEGNVERAGELLSELEEKYEEYKETIEELEALDEKEGSLAEQLADKEIDRSTYDDAVEKIEHKKHDLEEKLNKLRKEVIHENYEKPF